MRYFVTVGAETLEVEVHGDRVVLDGRTYLVDMQALAGTPVRHLLIDGRSYTLIAEKGDARGTWDVALDGSRKQIEVVDERTRAIRQMTARTGAQQGPKPLRAPMPGLVTRVQVAAGDSVKAGQGLVIMEAMKMENELKAAAAGVVVRVLVQAGEAVEKGAVLVEFEAA